MQTARRLYVYLIAGVSLGVLVAGASMLLTIGLEQIGVPGQGFIGRQAIGERLTLAAALVAVALPVWLIHWTFAERSVRPDQAEAAVERSATVRGLYLALVLGALLVVGATGLATAIRGVVYQATGTDLTSEGLSAGVAQLVVAGAAWLYHAWVRQRDWSRGPITGAGAWLPRTYLYVAAFVGLLSLLTGVAGLLEVAWTAFLRPPDLPVAMPWDTFMLANQLGNVIVGAVIWIGHAVHAERVVRDRGWRGDSERPARLRQAYFAAVVIAALSFTILHLSDAAGNAIRALAGVRLGQDDPPGSIVVPLLATIPFAVITWLHARPPRSEALASGSLARVETADRLGLYPVALVGLGFVAVGLARFGGDVINGLFGRSPFGGEDWFVHAVAQYGPWIVAGAAVSSWAWHGIAARVTADPAGEAASTIRRATILVALAGSVLAGISAAAVVLYRLFGSLFGIDQPGDAVFELSGPLATLVVAGAVAAFHALLLRADQAYRAPELAAPEPAAPELAAPEVAAPELAAPAVALPVGESRATVNLRIRGPADGDVLGALTSVRAVLPDGFDVEVLVDADAPDR